jgi:hypothetical protein
MYRMRTEDLLAFAMVTVYLAGAVALAAAWIPTARSALRQEKQDAYSWTFSPGLMNLPYLGYLILALVGYMAYQKSGRMSAAGLAAWVAGALACKVAMVSVALSVV